MTTSNVGGAVRSPSKVLSRNQSKASKKTVKGAPETSRPDSEGIAAHAKVDTESKQEIAERQEATALAELKEDIERAQAAAREALEENDIIGAISIYTDAIIVLDDTEQGRWKAKLLLRRARAHAMRGAMYQCADDAAQAAELEPRMQKAYLLRGHALMSTQQFGPASECFRRGLENHPMDNALRSGFEESVRRIQGARHRFSKAFDNPFVQSFEDFDVDDVSSNLKLLSGVALELNDVYQAEGDRVRARGLDHDPFDRAEEDREIMAYLHRARSELFVLFCSYLHFPRDAPDTESAIAQLQEQAASGTHSLKRINRRNLDLTKLSSGGSFGIKAKRIPIGQWCRMTEEQFYRFSEKHILTEKFNDSFVSRVWAKLVAADPQGTILFPKFLEGVVRLMTLRFRAKDIDRTERSWRTLQISRRVFYALDKYVLASSEVYATLLPQLSRARVYIQILRGEIYRSKRVANVRTCFEPRLVRTFDYFKKQGEENMTFQELLEMTLRINLIDRHGKNIDDIRDTAVAIVMFAGDISSRCISFDDFVDIIIGWCDALTRDSEMVPFHERLEAFITGVILKPAERHSGLCSTAAQNYKK